MPRLPMILLATAATMFCQAQTSKPPPIHSPEITPDRRITFRIYAPQAPEVLLTGEWMGADDKPIPLSKDDSRRW